MRPRTRLSRPHPRPISKRSTATRAADFPIPSTVTVEAQHLTRPVADSETREQSSQSVGKCVKLKFLGTGEAAREQETERSGEARNDAQGSRECGESGGVRGAQVARPAFGCGLNGEAGARGARRALGAGPPDSPGRLRRARSASVLHAPAPRSAPRSVPPRAVFTVSLVVYSPSHTAAVLYYTHANPPTATVN